MTQFPADPPFGEIVSGQRPERKSSPASVLAAPRTPVTRWNRKYLAAGAAALAAIVGLGFYLGFGGANAVPKKAQDPQAAADTDNPEKPEIANRYAQGYADPAVRAGMPPGVADLPAPAAAGQPQVAAAAGAPPAPVDPAVAAAIAQSSAARAAGPFFGGGADQGAVDTVAPALALVAPPDAGARTRDAADVQLQNGQGEKRQFAADARADDYLANP